MNDTNPALFKTRIDEADRLYAEGRLRDAAATYQDLLRSRTIAAGELAAAFTSNDAWVIERLADLQIRLEHREEAGLLLSALQDIFRSKGNVFATVTIVLKRCELRLAESDLDGAFATLQEIDALTGDLYSIDFSRLKSWQDNCPLSKLPPGENGIIFPRLLYVLGRLQLGVGQYGSGLCALQYAFEAFPLTGHMLTKPLLVSLPAAIAQANLEAGDLDKARDWIRTAEKAMPEADDPWQRVSTWGMRARLELLQGRLGDAVGTLTAICDWYRNQWLVEGTLVSILNLAGTRIYLNQFAAAETLLDEAAALAAKLRKEEWAGAVENLRSLARQRSTSSVPTVSVIPTLFSIRGRTAGPSPAQDLPKKEPNKHPAAQQAGFLGRYEERALAFQTVLATGNLPRSAIALEGLQQVFGTSDSRLIKHRLQVLQYLLDYYRDGRVDTASMREACTYFQQQSMLPELWQAQRLLTWIPWPDPLERKKLIEMNQQLLTDLTASLPPDQQSVFLLNKWTEDEEFLNQQIMDLAAGDKGGGSIFTRIRKAIRSFIGITRLLTLIDAHKDKVFHDVLHMSKDVSSLKTGVSLYKRILFQPARRLHLSFLVLPDRTVVFYQRRFHLGLKVVNINRLQLRHWVQEWHRSSAGDVGAIDIASPERSHRLAALSSTVAREIGLIDLLDQVPGKVNRLSIVADDALCGFPFSTVLYKDAYLIERMAISIKFRSLPPSSPRPHPQKLPDALCVFVAKGDEHFAPLPGAEQEARAVKEILATQYSFGKIALVPDELASPANICREAASCRLLHIACHGGFDPQDPGASGLLLPDGEKLTIRQITTGRAFTGATHVTLSACWSADLFILPGRWIISLPEALAFVGVKSILGSFWQINDETALSFMRSFYRYAASMPKDVALQKCQIDAIRNSLPDCMDDTSNPFFWSGFGIYGLDADKPM